METPNTNLIKALRATFNEKQGRGKPASHNRHKHGDVRSDGRIFRCYEKVVRNNQIVLIEKWDSLEVYNKRMKDIADKNRAKTNKFKWQEFAILLINRLDQYEDTTDIQTYFRSLPR
jgi:hypothetical protein